MFVVGEDLITEFVDKLVKTKVHLEKTDHFYIPTRSEVIERFPCSTQLSMKFQLLIKTKMLKNTDLSCFQALRCCIYHAHKC